MEVLSTQQFNYVDKKITKQGMSKFFKTTIIIEILSEQKFNNTNLEDINYAITQGDCSGKVEITGYQELTSKEAAAALLAQGSDPEFFGLDENGKSLDDDLIGYQVEDRAGNHEIHPDMDDGSFCIYNWSQCEAMMKEDSDYWKIVPVIRLNIEEPTYMFEGDPND